MTQGRHMLMPPAAMLLFPLFLLAPAHAISGDLAPLAQPEQRADFDSGILHFDPGFFAESGLKRYLVFGQDSQFLGVSVMSEGAAAGASDRYDIMEDYRLDFFSEATEASGTPQITGSDAAFERYGLNGSGTTIAVVDTGVDFSNPDIQHSLARDANGHPVMLDPDGQGIIITNATFFARIDENGIVLNHDSELPDGADSSVYVDAGGVYLDVSQGGSGTVLSVYNSFYPSIGNSAVFEGRIDSDMKIGDDSRNYIKSKSGMYRVGVMYQGGVSGQFSGIQSVPVLVVDSFEAGVYDTIVPDLSSAWLDYTRGQLEPGEVPDYDFDFTDEKPIVLGSGKEFLVYDSDGDGRGDFSAGTVGAQVLDVHGVISDAPYIDEDLRAVNGTLLPALDPGGEFFGVMTDFEGHGTSSAATVSSRGHERYGVYGKDVQYSISGAAPGASILPVKALWFGDVMYGWLWTAGFEQRGAGWEYSGKRADIISNSWGISQFPSAGVVPGFDGLSLIHGALGVPRALHEDYPGVLMVTSAGNSGHGYGTIGPPASSPFGITVGATTNNVFVGYGQFDEQPRFGSDTIHRDHIVDFSSRGPGPIGDPKPDLVSVGAFGFVPTSVLKQEMDSKEESFGMFGGTSMAAPAVAGAAAVVMEGMRAQQMDADPFTIKNILMSTARDTGNDPFTQGAGLADAATALDYVYGKNGTFAVYNEASYGNLAGVLEPAAGAANFTGFGLGPLVPPGSRPMTSWFAGHLFPGESSRAEFTIHNPAEVDAEISIEPRGLLLVQRTEFNGTTTPRQHDSFLNETDAFVPDYVALSDVKRHATLGEFFEDESPIPANSSLLVLAVNFDFGTFMNSTSDLYADDLRISSLYLYDWIDANNDTEIASDELSMVSRAGSWGTVQELRISDPAEKFEGTPLVGVYPVPTRFSYWGGDTGMDAAPMEYTISASYYRDGGWPAVWIGQDSVEVPAGGYETVSAVITAPAGAQTGVYQGFVEFAGTDHAARAPVSFVVRQAVPTTDTIVEIRGSDSDDIMYGNGYVKGAFDMTNRYMAGDWRQYYFDIQDDTIDTIAVELSWDEDDTSHSVFVADPEGRIIQTSVPSGVFGHFEDWPSLDWLGTTPFSEGGGFFPVENNGKKSTVLFVPVNQTGTHTILTHSTLFAGSHATEPLHLVAKFTNLRPPEAAAEEPPAAPPDPAPAPGFAPGLAAPVPEPEPEEPPPDNTALGIIVGLSVGAIAGALFISMRRKTGRTIEQGL